MTDLLLHPHTRRDIESIIKQPAQALLFIGRRGSGKSFLSRNLTKQLLGVDSLENEPYYHEISNTGTSIGIEQIRDLQNFLKLRVASKRTGDIIRIVTIPEAERMSTEAQNALLKTLEEPPAGSMIILTAQTIEGLLATITSRVRVVPVLPVSENSAREHFKDYAVDEASFRRTYAISDGGIGLLTTLLQGDDNELTETITLAKEILAEPIAKRLLRVETLAKDKDKIGLLLDSFYRITRAGLRTSATKNATQQLRQWQAKQNDVLEAITVHRKNANTKLLLDHLFMNI